ncbi:unnamed protein product [Prunus brigantina]
MERYVTNQSSCSWFVRFALSLKGLPYEYKPVNITKGEQFSPVADFKRLNPLHFVPVLVDGDITVSDSYAILLVSVICWKLNYFVHVICSKVTIDPKAFH